MTEPLITTRLVAIEYAAVDTLSFILQPLQEPSPLIIDPGSHVDVHLPNGLVRSYSLSNGPGEKRGYRLTVARDPSTRGGSSYMHDSLKVGQAVKISKPRNHFRPAKTTALSVFFAGGIGITPFISMIARLDQWEQSWRLHYCVRKKESAAFINELSRMAGSGTGEVLLNCDDVDGVLDLGATISALPPDAHLYCCGPSGMLDTFRTIAADTGFPDEQIHFEYFSADVDNATEGGFSVLLNKSGREILVEPGETILQAIIKSGISLSYSCEEGICGACETRVIEGLPEHRDMILSEREREENQTMMICCSGSKTRKLVLDL